MNKAFANFSFSNEIRRRRQTPTRPQLLADLKRTSNGYSYGVYKEQKPTAADSQSIRKNAYFPNN
jgi:hypothetical protein